MLKSKILAFQLGSWFFSLPVNVGKIKGKNNVAFTFSKRKCIYNSVHLLLVILININAVYFKYKIHMTDVYFHTNSNVTLIANCSITIFLTLFIIVNVISNIIYCKDIIKYEEDMEFYNNYLFRSVDKETIVHKLALILLSCVSVVLIFDSVHWYLTMREYLYLYSYCNIEFIRIIFIMLYTANVVSIGTHFQSFNKFLLSISPEDDCHYLQNKISASGNFGGNL